MVVNRANYRRRLKSLTVALLQKKALNALSNPDLKMRGYRASFILGVGVEAFTVREASMRTTAGPTSVTT